jgi:hypothetical protein
MPAPGGTTHRDSILANAPPWFPDRSPSNPSQPGAGGSLLYALGLLIDCLDEAIRQGVTDRFPTIGQGIVINGLTLSCDPTALPLIGNDRLIDRGFQETDGSYCARLVQWLSTWSIAGNAWSVLQNLLGYVSPAAPIWRIVTSVGIWDSMNDPAAPVTGTPTWRVYPTAPGNWDWDGNQSNWWRFFTIVYPPASLWVAAPNWGATGLYWGGYSGSWGLSASSAQVASMRKIVGKFLREGSWCQWMIVSFDSTLFPPLQTLPSSKLPDGTWGPWSKTVSGQRVPTRNANARYCNGSV